LELNDDAEHFPPLNFYCDWAAHVKGRGLAETDTKGAAPAIVVNETMVKKYFKGQEPIGKRILIQQIISGRHELGPEVPWQVVGVVADEKVSGLDDSSAGVYVSYKQRPAMGVALIVRGALDPNASSKESSDPFGS
jgi:hypothetical protein